MAPDVNYPRVHYNSLSLISSDSCTPENSRTNFNMERENVTGYRLGISYTCTALRYNPAFIAT